MSKSKCLNIISPFKSVSGVFLLTGSKKKSIVTSMQTACMGHNSTKAIQEKNVPLWLFIGSIVPSVMKYCCTMFQQIEKEINTLVKNELKSFKNILMGQDDYREDKDIENEEQSRTNREAVLKITVNILKRMQLNTLADLLQNSKRI